MWAAALCAGIPDEVFWDLTPHEVAAVIDQRAEEERRATLRAALIAATIVNVHLPKGRRMVQPSDFIQELPREEDYLDVDVAQSVMDRWAQSVSGGAHVEL